MAVTADNRTAACWLAAADMGYGHLRAVHALSALAEGSIMTAGVDDGASDIEKELWSRVMRIYAAFSRASNLPVVGRTLFSALDWIQRIRPDAPGLDLARPTFQVGLLERLVRSGLCSGMMEKIRSRPIPLVTSFYAQAIAADLHGRKNIYCIICDAGIHRVWAARSPKQSSISYFAPCERAEERLLAYGVPRENIFLTGFPLPEELLGEGLSVLGRNFRRRIARIDPRRTLSAGIRGQIAEALAAGDRPVQDDPGAGRPLTITYAVGGAGAQKEIGGMIARSLAGRLAEGSVKLNLVAGLNLKVRDFFEAVMGETTARKPAPGAVEIIWEKTFGTYFARFNRALHETDILWTKPSELSFYSALGLPIIMSPPLGSQEEYNRRWLQEIGAGIPQMHPGQTDRWLFEMLEGGALAGAAWRGFAGVRKLGTRAITDVLMHGMMSNAESIAAPPGQ